MALKPVLVTLREDQIEYLDKIKTLFSISRNQQIRNMIDEIMKEADE